MAGRRKKPKALVHSAEFLKKTEEYHHYVTRVTSDLRIGEPHCRALLHLTDELRQAYCVIAGCDVVPWAQVKPSNIPPQQVD